MYAIWSIMCVAHVRHWLEETCRKHLPLPLSLSYKFGKETKSPFLEGIFCNASVFALTIWFSSSTNCNQRNVLAAAAKKQNVFILNVNAVVLHFWTGICVASVLVSAKKELNSSGLLLSRVAPEWKVLESWTLGHICALTGSWNAPGSLIKSFWAG